MNNITDVVNKLYKVGYLDKYGGSIFITFITLLVFFILISYFQVQNSLKSIKANWVQDRCNPLYIPFAGLINKPPGMTSLEYTGKNFTSCINNILISITQDFLKPIHYLMDVIKNAGSGITSDVNSVRSKIYDMLGQIGDIDTEIMGKILGFLMPLRQMLSKMKSIMHKTQATLVTSMYGIISGYLGLKSFVGAFIQICIDFLIALAAIVIILFIFIFTIEAGVAALVIWIATAALVLPVTIGLADVLHMTESSVPPKPRCFDKNTILFKEHGIPCKISHIKLGDILTDGSKVTAKFKLSTYKLDMYTFNNVIVSGNHHVLMADDIWMSVRNLEEATKIDDYREEFIYCINTTSKVININNFIFSDWDDLDDLEIIDIRRKCLNIIPHNFNKKYIHKYLEGGFIGSTLIELEDGRSVPIKDIEVNESLRFGELVLGIVEIDTHNIDVCAYEINKRMFVCGPNNVVVDKEIGYSSLMDIKGSKIEYKPYKLYHLITDTNCLMIDGIKFYDYNGSLEHLLNNTIDLIQYM